MIAKKGRLIEENLAKAILSLTMFVLVFLFLFKYFQPLEHVPLWARSINSVEKAIENLDPESEKVIRTANVQLEDYFIRGYAANTGVCPELFEEKPHCICACKDVECSNARQDNNKYCRSIAIKPSSGFAISQEEDSPITIRIGINKTDEEPLVVLKGVVA